MARAFRLLIAVLALTFLGYAGPVSAAPDCFQVSEKIKRLSLKDGLLEVKNATRQHLRSFKREGSSYEGQYDIACLIGQYMTLTDGNSSAISADEAFRRYKDVESWFVKRFKEGLVEYAKAIADYKNNPDLVEQEREEGYANSEFVLWSLAGSVNNAYQTMPEVSWKTSKLLDEVWCGDPLRAKAQFNQYRGKLPEEARKTIWSALSESEFERAQTVFRPAPNGLDALCGGADLVVSSRDITGLKSRYMDVATAEVKKGWISSLKEGANIDQENWKEIAWLGLPCAKAPTEKQYDLFQGLRWYEDNPPSKKWWTDVVQRELAEDLFDERLNERLRRAGDACTEMIAQEINNLRKIATRWKNEYRREVLRSLTHVWLEGQQSQKLVTKLSELYDHVSLVTGASKNCASPSKGDRAAIQKLQVFIDRVSDGKSAFRELTTLKPFIRAENALPAAEKVAARCAAIPQIGLVTDRFKETRQEYRNWARVQSAVVWGDATKGRYNSELEDIIKRVDAKALPSAQEKRAVAYLYGLKQDFNAELEQALRGLPDRLSPLIADAKIYRNILEKQYALAESFEGKILDKWVDILGSKNCNVAVKSSKGSASLTPQCLGPSEEDAQVLANYCQLKKLRQSIAQKKEREGNNEGGGDAEGGDAEGGDAEGGGAEGGGALLLPNKPFWDHANAIQVAILGNLVGGESFEELTLENPVSSAVKDAEFSDARGLQIALSQIAKNDRLEGLLKSKLQGCDEGGRYKSEIRKLKELREFYIGAYDALCADQGLASAYLHCEMAEFLYKGGARSSIAVDDPDNSRPDSGLQIHSIEWRSETTLGKDRVVVELKGAPDLEPIYDDPTNKDAITQIEQGVLVQVVWYPNAENNLFVRRVFPCCNFEELKENFRGVAKLKQLKDRIQITFLKDAPQVSPAIPKFTSCTIHYPAEVHVSKGGTSMLRFPSIFQDQILNIYPKRKIELPQVRMEVRIGESIPGTFLTLAAVGQNYIVLAPARLNLERLGGKQLNKGLSVNIDFDQDKVRFCQIK